ncbi:hypothetical protein ACLOJK_024285, partial [Asimina triloba]
MAGSWQRVSEVVADDNSIGEANGHCRRGRRTSVVRGKRRQRLWLDSECVGVVTSGGGVA